ncbi:Rv3235 family protein [Streptomyces caniferus]|uniref:Rv3235 family protein n=1 Tax=Streptomyces caniferus TaxID=285557 RepID=UPI0034513B33
MTGTHSTTAHTTTAVDGEHTERPTTPAPSTGTTPAPSTGSTREASTPLAPAPPTGTRPLPPTGTTDARGPRTRPTSTPESAPTVPRPRRSPSDRRPLGPAGSSPGSTGRAPGTGGRGPGSGPAGRGPTRTAARPGRPAALAAAASRRPRTGAPTTPVNAAGVPLPTVGAQRRAHESRPHHWFAHQLVLALSGQRPVHALLGHALPAAYDRLAELAPQAPLRPVTPAGQGTTAPTVRDCGLCRPRRGVIEAFARIAADGRLRALAFRLELGADSRWRCAALDIGPAPAVRGPVG